AAHTGPITGLAFAPDGRSLVTIGGDKFIKRWSTADGKLQGAYEGHTNPAGRPEFSPDGSRLVTTGGVGDESVWVWDAATARPLVRAYNTPAQNGNVSFHHDSQTFVMAVRNSPVHFWNVKGIEDATKTSPPYGKSTKPEEAARFEVSIAIHGVSFSPD